MIVKCETIGDDLAAWGQTATPQEIEALRDAINAPFTKEDLLALASQLNEAQKEQICEALYAD